jgi:hypothetical protein
MRVDRAPEGGELVEVAMGGTADACATSGGHGLI